VVNIAFPNPPTDDIRAFALSHFLYPLTKAVCLAGSSMPLLASNHSFLSSVSFSSARGVKFSFPGHFFKVLLSQVHRDSEELSYNAMVDGGIPSS